MDVHCHLVSFDGCDLIMLRLHPERFQTTKFKLQSKSAGPFKIVRKTSVNAYMLDLPKDWSPTFTIEDLTLYHGHHKDESYEEQAL